jgi:hypothetical protein
MSSHAALGVVRAGVAVLKGEKAVYPEFCLGTVLTTVVGTGVRINCISPGQIDVGVDLKGVCFAGFLAAVSPGVCGC